VQVDHAPGQDQRVRGGEVALDELGPEPPYAGPGALEPADVGLVAPLVLAALREGDEIGRRRGADGRMRRYVVTEVIEEPGDRPG